MVTMVQSTCKVHLLLLGLPELVRSEGGTERGKDGGDRVYQLEDNMKTLVYLTKVV